MERMIKGMISELEAKRDNLKGWAILTGEEAPQEELTTIESELKSIKLELREYIRYRPMHKERCRRPYIF